MATVNGPASSTNNAIALWNGTAGDTIKDSPIVVESDAGNVNVKAASSGTNTNLGLQAKGAGHCTIYNDDTEFAEFYGDSDSASMDMRGDYLIQVNPTEVLHDAAGTRDMYLKAEGIYIVAGGGSGGILVTDTGTPTITARGATNENLALAGKGTGIVTANGHEVVTHAIANAKGDLIAGTADNALTRLGVGSNGQVLTADSAEATGLKWATPTGGGGGGGDVTGPASSTQYELPMFADTTGKVLSRSSIITDSYGIITTGGIGGSGSVDVLDANFRISDNNDATKQLRIECSRIATSTTRTLTVPNESGIIALVGSGRICADVVRAIPPATLYAQETTIAGGSSPAENTPVWAFDPSTIEYMDFLCYLSPQYAGGGLTIELELSCDATSGNGVFGVAIREHDAALTGAHTYSFTDQTAAVDGTAQNPYISTITLSDGAAMDNWSAGKWATVRVRRNATSASDTVNSNDVYLKGITIRET